MDRIGDIICGFVVGFFFGMALMITFGVHINLAKDAVAECQSTLPRNQTCKYVITAVPEVAE